MDLQCEQVHAFADGELGAEEAERFREHLAGCEGCQAEVRDIARLGALAGALRQRQAPVELPGSGITPISSAPRRRGPFLRRWYAGAAVGLAAAAGLVVALLGHDPAADVEDDLRKVADASPIRMRPERFAHPAAGAFHPYDPNRGGSPEEAPPPSTPAVHQALERLESGDDAWAKATVWMLRGEPARAASLLEHADPSPGVKSDRAAVELSRHQPALALALADEALAEKSTLQAARWNRGLALDELGLPLAAAEAFRAVAAVGEPRWSDEACTRAEALSAGAQARLTAWREASRSAAPRVDAGVAGGIAPDEQGVGLEQRLLGEVARCHESGMEHRCVEAERLLGRLYLAMNRPADARKHAAAALQNARVVADWGLETALLQDVAEAARADGAGALAAAYSHELELRRATMPASVHGKGP